jgi:hypothetical protein
MLDSPKRQASIPQSSLPQSIAPLTQLLDSGSYYNDSTRSGKQKGSTYSVELDGNAIGIAMATGGAPTDAWTILEPSAGGGAGITKASYFANSFETLVLSIDPDNPSYLTNLNLLHSDSITLVDNLTGTIRNDTGHSITMTGSISFNPEKVNGTPTLNIVSERSNDGITWFGNLDSRRSMEISNNNESFSTKVSLIVDFPATQLARFRIWVTNGNVNFHSTSTTALGGQVFRVPSVLWELSEI